MPITMTESLRNSRHVVRYMGMYLEAKQNAADFLVAAAALPNSDPPNFARNVCTEHSAQWAFRVTDYRRDLQRVIGESFGLIERRNDWRHMHCTTAFEVQSRRQKFRALGTAMKHAIKDEDGDYFISKVWNAGITRDLKNKLRERMEEATSVEFASCECCGDLQCDDDGHTWSWVDDGDGNDERWCSSCEDDNARWSQEMGTFIRDSAAIPYYRHFSSWQTEDADDWVTMRWVRRQDDVYLEDEPNSGRTSAVTDDVLQEIREESETPDVYDYHSGVRVGHIASTYDKRKHPVLVGIELEFEFNGNREMNESVRWLKDSELNEGYYIMERDGSLNCGFEAITGHTGLDVHEDKLSQMLHHQGDLYQNARTDARSNGTHVHVSKLNMSILHQTRLAKFIYHPDNRAFMNQLAGRRIGGDYNREVDWLQLAKDAGSRHAYFKSNGYTNRESRNYARDALTDWSRYGALSVCTSTGQSIEFRMFKGSTDWSEIMAWAEFAFVSWHFALQWGMNDMTVDKFIAFVYRADNRADTKNLRKYLQGVMQHERALHESRRYKPAKPQPIQQLPLPSISEVFAA